MATTTQSSAGVLRAGGVPLIDNVSAHARSSLAHDLEERASSQRVVTVYSCRRLN